MYSNNFSSARFTVLLYIALLVSIQFPSCISFDWFASCSNKFGCGIITNVGFPFWGDGRPQSCGYPQTELICKSNQTKINITDVTYDVLSLDQDKQILRLVRVDFLSGFCSPNMKSSSFDTQTFEYAPDSGNLTLFYNCSVPDPSGGSLVKSEIPGYFTCPNGSIYDDGFFSLNPQFNIGVCKSSVTVGIPKNYIGDVRNSTIMEKALREGFGVKYKVDIGACKECTSSEGVCGYDWNKNQTACYCQGQSSPSQKICTRSASGTPQGNSGMNAH